MVVGQVIVGNSSQLIFKHADDSDNHHECAMAISYGEQAEDAGDSIESDFREAPENGRMARRCNACQVWELRRPCRKTSSLSGRQGNSAKLLPPANAKSCTRPPQNAYSLHHLCCQIPMQKALHKTSDDFEEGSQSRHGTVGCREQNKIPTISVAQTAGGMTSSDRPIILKNIHSKQNTRLVVVSTTNASLNAEDITVEERAGVMMGQMSDDTSQKISADHSTLSVSDQHFPPTQASGSFLGTGHSLTASQSTVQRKADPLV